MKVPLRSIGQLGVNTDQDPFELPPQAFTKARNVIFENRKIKRGPVFKLLLDSTVFGSGRGIASPDNPLWAQATFVMDFGGRVFQVGTSGNAINMTPAGVAYQEAEGQVSDTFLSNVLYFNRPGSVPYWKASGASIFSLLTTHGWPSGARCRSLRAFRSGLVAIGFSPDGSARPTTVAWSEFSAAEDIPPANWAFDNPASSAGFITLGEMRSSLVDGLPLRDQLMLYSSTEVYAMSYAGDTLVYRVDPLFTHFGAIGTNCIAEIDQKHFVFGLDDLWVHNGATASAIASNRVKEYVYNRIDRTKYERFFVHADKRKRRVYFCYITKSITDSNFVSEYPNEAVVYSVDNDTWTFMDLPGILGIANGNLSFSAVDTSWNAAGGTWAEANGPWNSAQEGRPTFPICVSWNGVLSVLDESGPEALTSLPKWITAERFYSYLERTNIDMAQLMQDPPSNTYWNIHSVYPRGCVSDTPIRMSFGGSTVPQGAVSYRPYVGFNPGVDSKLDWKNSGGRSLAYRIAFDNTNHFEISGFDLDVSPTGYR